MELDLHGQIKKRKGWQKVILLTIQGYFDNKVGRNAAAMTYYLLFAMFPFFIFVTSLLGLLHLPTLTLDGQITRFLPEDVVAFLNLAIEHITKSSNNALLTFGLVFSVWFLFGQFPTSWKPSTIFTARKNPAAIPSALPF